MSKYLGIGIYGTYTRATNPQDLTKPLMLGEDGKIITGGGSAEGYLFIRDDGVLGIGNVRTQNISKVYSYSSHSLFLLSDGSVYSCGNNYWGQLGRIASNGSPTYSNLGKVDIPEKVIDIACCGGKSFFLLSDGRVYSCGYNNDGGLGRITPSGSQTMLNLGVIERLHDIIKVEAAEEHVIFLQEGGTVYNCGNNEYGQLGRIIEEGSASSPNLGILDALSKVSEVSAGMYHSLFLLADGTVWSCGENQHGQLGNSSYGGASWRLNLGQVQNISNVSAISAGGEHSLFLQDGKVFNCGFNGYGQLGRSVDSTNYPGVIAALENVSSISAGIYHSLFLLADGTVWSCGENYKGQLGRAVPSGTEGLEDQPESNLGRINDLSNGTSINAGYSSFFSLGNSTIYSCGYNDHGQLGRAVPNGSEKTTNLGKLEFAD